MEKFISFILDEERVRAYFGIYFKIFFILLTNFICLYLSIFILKNNNEFTNEYIPTRSDRIIQILLSFNFLYILYFNLENKEELKKSFFHKCTKLSIFAFLVISYIDSISFIDFSFFYFLISFSYILILNILIKNKRLSYYLILLFIFFLSIFFPVASLITVKRSIESPVYQNDL